MAIEKMMTPNEVELLGEGPDLEVEVMTDADSAVEVEMDDGSVVINFGSPGLDDDLDAAMADHNANLAEGIEDAMLESMASELVEDFDNDRASRKEWATSYINGLDLLGMKIEDRSQPWQGASGVYHPMLTEAVVRFQAQAMSELMPASGPVKSKIVGKMTPEKFKQSQRVETELNYLITEEMPDYRNEIEQLPFKLPLAGSAFKKMYYDPILEHPVSVFVPSEDFVASYGRSNPRTCPR